MACPNCGSPSDGGTRHVKGDRYIKSYNIIQYSCGTTSISRYNTYIYCFRAKIRDAARHIISSRYR